jgi:hypothetical protein
MNSAHPRSRFWCPLCRWAAVLVVALILCGAGATDAWAKPKKPVVQQQKQGYILAYSIVFFVFALGTFVAIRPGSRAAEG